MNKVPFLPPVHSQRLNFGDQLLSKISALSSLLFFLLLTACSDGYLAFPTTSESQNKLGDGVDLIVLNEANVINYSSPTQKYRATALPVASQWAYSVGPGDILSVTVFNHPELTLPQGNQSSSKESGFQVGIDGTINYPFIGSVSASGLSVDHIRSDISQRLATFIPDPQVDVRVAAFNAQAVVISGEVNTPSRQPLSVIRLTLIDAINESGGFTEAGDQRSVNIQRDGQMYDVDVQGFLFGGLSQNNPILRNGDIVSVPRRRAKEAYLMGELARTDAIDLSHEAINLTQAVTRIGGLQKSRADARGVLIFRTSNKLTQVFQLDMSNPSGILLGTSFELKPGDVVYVLRSTIQRWNDTIMKLLPSVQAINTTQNINN